MSGASLIEHFAALRDPRQSWKVLFPLPEILLIVLCGTLAGAEDFVEISRWGQMHEAFLRRLLPFKAGVPSHDTLNDVINAIDGVLFAQCFTAWVEGLREPAPASAAPEIVAIDGKTSRRTHDRGKDRGPLHLVSAWASSQRPASKRARPSPMRSPPFRASWTCSDNQRDPPSSDSPGPHPLRRSGTIRCGSCSMAYAM